jgi:hypothetical protein
MCPRLTEIRSGRVAGSRARAASRSSTEFAATPAGRIGVMPTNPSGTAARMDWTMARYAAGSTPHSPFAPRAWTWKTVAPASAQRRASAVTNDK